VRGKYIPLHSASVLHLQKAIYIIIPIGGELMLSPKWERFCEKGKYSKYNQVKSVEKCIKNGRVHGYYSDFPLNPNLKDTSALYPSHDHTTFPKDDSKMVVDLRIINDMKSMLNEKEFWQIIEHLYAVGKSKGKITELKQSFNFNWIPKRNYKKLKKIWIKGKT
jgi:hypothetical protein